MPPSKSSKPGAAERWDRPLLIANVCTLLAWITLLVAGEWRGLFWPFVAAIAVLFLMVGSRIVLSPGKVWMRCKMRVFLVAALLLMGLGFVVTPLAFFVYAAVNKPPVVVQPPPSSPSPTPAERDILENIGSIPWEQVENLLREVRTSGASLRETLTALDAVKTQAETNHRFEELIQFEATRVKYQNASNEIEKLVSDTDASLTRYRKEAAPLVNKESLSNAEIKEHNQRCWNAGIWLAERRGTFETYFVPTAKKSVDLAKEYLAYCQQQLASVPKTSLNPPAAQEVPVIKNRDGPGDTETNSGFIPPKNDRNFIEAAARNIFGGGHRDEKGEANFRAVSDSSTSPDPERDLNNLKKELDKYSLKEFTDVMADLFRSARRAREQPGSSFSQEAFDKFCKEAAELIKDRLGKSTTIDSSRVRGILAQIATIVDTPDRAARDQKSAAFQKEYEKFTFASDSEREILRLGLVALNAARPDADIYRLYWQEIFSRHSVPSS